MDAVAKTNDKWVAYKYDAGLGGFSTALTPRVTWRDTGGHPQQYAFGGVTNQSMVPLKIEGSGDKRAIVADVEWTFPLSFVEVVWGDGKRIERQVVSATDQSAFGTKRFSLPFDAAGKAWVRFAVWDSAGNGAFVQPVWVK